MRRALLGVVAVMAGAMALGLGGEAAPNLVQNGSFEGSLSGWGAAKARLQRSADGVVGRRAARVLVVSGAGSFSIYPNPKPVRSTAPRTSYLASAWVRSDRADRTLCLRIREWAAGDVAGSGQTCATVGKAWQQLTELVYTPAAARRSLDVYVYRPRAVAGDSFEVDGVSLVQRAVTPPPPQEIATLIAVGDIATCDSNDDLRTADLAAGLDGTVATLGDNVYERGTPTEFEQCYAPSWGRLKSGTRPSPGNHDYSTKGGAGYFGYFGSAAGPDRRGYYSYDLGAWHVLSLNSNCDVIDCRPEVQWLKDDLAEHRARCTLAYWHHARFSSGLHGSDPMTAPLYQVLYDAGADVVLTGHDHDYERFAPQDPAGRADPIGGLREFVVGTGGRSLRNFQSTAANSQVRNRTTFGVLGLRLLPKGYEWRFLPVSGGTFTDAGSDSCH